MAVSLRRSLLSTRKFNEGGENSSKREELDLMRRGALGKGCGIESRRVSENPFTAPRYCIFYDREAEDLNDGSVSMLRHRQDHAIALLRTGAILAVLMVMLRTVGVLVSVNSASFVRRGKLFEEMMDAMGCGNDQKEQERNRAAQITGTPGQPAFCSRLDHRVLSYSAAPGIAIATI